MPDIAKIATGNTTFLKELSVEEVLELHPLLDAQNLPYFEVQKTKPIKAKPLADILHDDSVSSKILLTTLEGNQDLRANSIICWGVDNDVWQTTEAKLHDKYTPTYMGGDGWVTFEPKPEYPVRACQITEELGLQLGPHGGWCVEQPKWGDQRIVNGVQTYLHYGVINDYVMQWIGDPTDVYRVAKRFYDNTYEAK